MPLQYQCNSHSSRNNQYKDNFQARCDKIYRQLCPLRICENSNVISNKPLQCCPMLKWSNRAYPPLQTSLLILINEYDMHCVRRPSGLCAMLQKFQRSVPFFNEMPRCRKCFVQRGWLVIKKEMRRFASPEMQRAAVGQKPRSQHL